MALFSDIQHNLLDYDKYLDSLFDKNAFIEESNIKSAIDLLIRKAFSHTRAVDKPPYISNHLKYNGTFLVKINRGHYNEKGHGLLCHGLYHSF